ncbi:MAG: RecX family transcriptional regulator [Ignavibacteria bacterium]|nr:RecX family transcriptional regulator [Ignavibacteria bacterium]
MVTKLKQKKLSDTAVNKVIKLLEEQKYLNDENFADNFVKEKIRNKKVGKRTLIGKLLEKGISKEISESIVSENYSADEEFEVAEKVRRSFFSI